MNVAEAHPNLDEAKHAVITVGDGRGFVVHGKRGPLVSALVITAAHCLPFFPPCCSFSFTEERTYKSLLGPLGAEPTVSAECLFVDPIGDICILGSPDNQERWKEADAYEAMTEAASTLPIADAPENGRAWLLSLNNQWFRCEVQHCGGPFLVCSAAENLVGGMSGSPILDDDGAAIGVFTTSSSQGDSELSRKGGPNPRLAHNLPGWLLSEHGWRGAR